MRRTVVVSGPVVILIEAPAVGADQDGANGMMPVIERDTGEFDATTQMFEINWLTPTDPESTCRQQADQ